MLNYDDQIAELRVQNRRAKQAGYNRALRQRKRESAVPDARAVHVAMWSFFTQHARTDVTPLKRAVVGLLVASGYDETAATRVVDRMAAKPTDVDTPLRVESH